MTFLRVYMRMIVIIYIIIDRCAPGFAESKSETHKNARDFDSSDIFKDTIH